MKPTTWCAAFANPLFFAPACTCALRVRAPTLTCIHPSPKRRSAAIERCMRKGMNGWECNERGDPRALRTPLTPPSSWTRETRASLRTDREWHGTGAEWDRVRAVDPPIHSAKHKPSASRWGKISKHKHSRFCLVVLRPSFSLSPRATMLPALHEEGARACRAEQRTGHPAFSIRAGTPPDLSSAGSWDGIALAHRVRRGGVDNAMPLANMTIARDHTSYH